MVEEMKKLETNGLNDAVDVHIHVVQAANSVDLQHIHQVFRPQLLIDEADQGITEGIQAVPGVKRTTTCLAVRLG